MTMPINIPAWYLHIVVVGVSAFFFLSMSWVSMTFFVVGDRGAAMGKRGISVGAGGAAVYVLWRLLAGASASEVWMWVALLLYFYATALFYWAWHSNLSRPLDFAFFSRREPQHFNQSGPYRWIRHPFYSAYCAAWVASAVATQELGVFAIALSLVSTYIIAARHEERAFGSSPFADDYRRYSSGTGMFLPRWK